MERHRFFISVLLAQGKNLLRLVKGFTKSKHYKEVTFSPLLPPDFILSVWI